MRLLDHPLPQGPDGKRYRLVISAVFFGALPARQYDYPAHDASPSLLSPVENFTGTVEPWRTPFDVLFRDTPSLGAKTAGRFHNHDGGSTMARSMSPSRQPEWLTSPSASLRQASVQRLLNEAAQRTPSPHRTFSKAPSWQDILRTRSEAGLAWGTGPACSNTSPLRERGRGGGASPPPKVIGSSSTTGALRGSSPMALLKRTSQSVSVVPGTASPSASRAVSPVAPYRVLNSWSCNSYACPSGSATPIAHHQDSTPRGNNTRGQNLNGFRGDPRTALGSLQVQPAVSPRQAKRNPTATPRNGRSLHPASCK